MAKALLESTQDNTSGRSSAGLVTVVAVVAGIVGGISGGTFGYGAVRWQGPDLDLRARPRVAVVSYADALEDAPADQVGSRMVALDAKAQRLSDAGFVVFDDNAVVAWPSGLQVPAGQSHE